MKLLLPLLAPMALLAVLLGVVVVMQPPQPAAGVQPCTDVAQASSVDSTFDDEQLANAATIVRVGQNRQVPVDGLIVAVAAAMQESSLRNLPNGDRDSAGLFQMRPSAGWGTWAQVTSPVYAATAFFGGPDVPPDNPGLLDVPEWRQMSVAAAAQAVERSAHPTAYARWADDATTVVQTITGDGLDCRPAGSTDCPPSGLSVESGLTADAQLVVRCAVDTFGLSDIGGRATGGHTAGSDHYTGRAVDLMISDWNTPKGAAFGDRVADYFVVNADEFGVTYVIWRNRIWSTSRPSWRPYSHPDGRTDPTALHMDHLHISVSGNTAQEEERTP